MPTAIAACSHARYARTAYPPREGHLQHLHQRSSLRSRRHHSSLLDRKEGLREQALQKSRESPLRSSRAGKNPRHTPRFHWPYVQRVLAGISALGKNDQFRAATGKKSSAHSRSAHTIRNSPKRLPSSAIPKPRRASKSNASPPPCAAFWKDPFKELQDLNPENHRSQRRPSGTSARHARTSSRTKP